VSPVQGSGVRKRATILVRRKTIEENTQMFQRDDVDRRGHEGQTNGISAHGMYDNYML